ncbi:unnamed protein product, partial [Medioppia subpectinata]
WWCVLVNRLVEPVNRKHPSPVAGTQGWGTSAKRLLLQVVARSILETLNDVEPNDVQRVIAVISRLASDNEPSIRAELVEQLPQICMHLSARQHILPNGVPLHVLPILEQFLTDTNSHVRKMTQNAFTMLLEQNIIQLSFIEEHICPLLIQLTDFSNLDDYRIEAVGMMSKLVRFLGKESTEKLLLQTFTRLCLDVSFHVRRVCASNFGEFCTVVGQELTENVLLSRFRSLCQDSIWGVRKGCADFFVPVAITVSNQVRKEVLSPLFVNLLNDQSRWVKTAAFQSLGPFISTFADPSKTGLYYSDNGIVVIEDHTSNDSGLGSSESNANSPTDIDVDEVEETLNEEFSQLSTTSHKKQIDTENNEFSQFQFWRDPIPELQLEFEVNAQSLQMKTQSGDPLNEDHVMNDTLEHNCDSNINTKNNDSDMSQELSSNLSDDQKSVTNYMTEDPTEGNFELNFSQLNARRKCMNEFYDMTSDKRSNAWTAYNPIYPSADIMEVREPLLGLYSNLNMGESDELMSFAFGESMPMGSGYMFPYRRPPPSQDIIPNDQKQIDTENNEFSQFQFWRDPIPELQLEFEVNAQSLQMKTQSGDTLNEDHVMNDTLEHNCDSNTNTKNNDSEMSQELSSNLSDDQKSVTNYMTEDPNEGNFELNFSQLNARRKCMNEFYDMTSDKRSSAWTAYNPIYPSADIMEVREPLLGLYSNLNMGESDELMSFAFGESMPMGSGYMFPYRRPPPSQDIIPNDLLEHYLSMTNPIHYQTVDPDLCHHCAYSLPAVTLTLGRKNWSCLRETYELLAAEMQWKVRWTLASSLHQMSNILGSELTTRDLLPVFLSFMKDLDEVRFGILQNLAPFLKLLLRPQQQGILPKISEFLKMDNTRNWRFRQTLAQQIIELADIYTASEIMEYLLPIGLVLLNDKVSEVRLAAIRLISVLIKQIFESFLYDPTTYTDNRLDIIWELNSQLAESSKWIQRQTYILVCDQLIQNESIPTELFIDKMLQHLLNLSDDNVPNIRLVLARTLANTFWPIAQFRSHLKVQQTLEDLQSDKDKDVRQQSSAVHHLCDTLYSDNI